MKEREPIGTKVNVSMLKILRMPWTKLQLILVTLEKGAEANKELIELIRKTNTVLEVLLRILTQIFINPKEESDGLIELLIKSVAGTVDLITLTVRGVDNSPTTIYLKLNDIFKKRPVAHPSLAFSLNTKQSKTLRESMRGGFEITIDENELKRQVIEDLNKANQYCRGCVFENIPKEVNDDIKRIQELQTNNLEAQRTKISTINPKDLSQEVITKLSQSNTTNSQDIDLEQDFNYAFPGFPSTLGEPNPELNEELAGFDNTDEFDDTDISLLSSDIEISEDFVTVKGEDDVPIEIIAPNIKNVEFQDSLEEDKESLVIEKTKGKNRSEKIVEKAKSLVYSKYKDDYRAIKDDKVGGIPLVDKKVMQLLRDVAKEYLKQFFGRIFSGNFNLTTISFPIKCMRPLSLLESFAYGGALNCIYLTKAASLSDPIERTKYIISAQLSTFYSTSSFLKPVYICFTIA
jgi:hypothetical protein